MPETETDKPLFRFGVLADVQYADQPPLGSRYFRQALDKLRECVEDFNRRDLAFVVQLGDLIDRDFNNFNPVLAELRQLRTPVYHVLGNHDYHVLDHDKPLIRPTLELDAAYYESTIGKWRLIFLDGNDLSIPATTTDSPRRTTVQEMIYRLAKDHRPNANECNGAIGGKQLTWLSDRLERATRQGESVLLFCHYPLSPLNEGTLLNWEEVLRVISRYNCAKAWFCGHYHAGNYQRHQHIHLLNFKGMLETERENSYAVVSVYRDTLVIEGLGREPSRTLSLDKPLPAEQPNPRNET